MDVTGSWVDQSSSPNYKHQVNLPLIHPAVYSINGRLSQRFSEPNNVWT